MLYFTADEKSKENPCRYSNEIPQTFTGRVFPIESIRGGVNLWANNPPRTGLIMDLKNSSPPKKEEISIVNFSLFEESIRRNFSGGKGILGFSPKGFNFCPPLFSIAQVSSFDISNVFRPKN